MSGSSSAVPLPPSSRVQIVESNENRQVIFIPEGGKRSKGIGCFALIWNGIVGVVSTGIILAGGDDEMPLHFVIPFMSLFWLVGLGMLYWWLKMRFTRTTLLLEPKRIVIQRIFLGRKSITETDLNSDSHAALLVAYEENDVPVYTVAIEGVDSTAKFGTRLTREEKEWFVENINSFLNVSSSPSETGNLNRQDADSSTDIIPEKLSPYDLSEESLITVDESHAERLKFHYLAFPKSGKLKAILGFVALFTLIWMSFVFFFFGLGLNENKKAEFQVFEIIVTGMMTLGGFMPIFLIVGVMRSRITIDLNSDRISGRWHFGPMSVKKEFPTASVTRVALTNRLEKSRRHKNTIEVGPKSLRDLKVCTVFAGEEFMPLTTFHELATAREISGLLIHRLGEMGITLQDA
jgi:hypothetical protein